MKKLILAFILSCTIICSAASCAPAEIARDDKSALETESSDIQLPEEGLPVDSLSPESIVYLGAFQLPDDGEEERQMYAYGGEALCYNPLNNSLFITGHNWYAYVSEITIPETKLTDNIFELPKAKVIKEFTDIKGDLFDDWTMEIPRAGLEVIDGNLFFCFGEHYEEDTKSGTHGYTSLDLSEAKKVCIVGDYLYSTNDYLFAIPNEFTDYFYGKDLLTGRFRDGGWSGMGPSLFAISTEDIMGADNDQRIEALPIIKYDDSFGGDDGNKMNNYSHADSWAGGAFISCAAGSAIVFVGTHGYGDTWYGFANGVVYPTSGDEDDVYPDVPDYPYDQRGWWNNDFRACIAFYDVNDAQKAIRGQIEPYEMQPYAFLDISEYMLAEKTDTDMQHLGASAYDYENNRLYVIELFADEGRPIVHVFTFE
ncbi:MAG: hypothetical protein JXN65_05630 [Clostridia bacterium]|nr:hypothetical protein [Clostridia bacterium]